jgi:hypothetical protein
MKRWFHRMSWLLLAGLLVGSVASSTEVRNEAQEVMTEEAIAAKELALVIELYDYAEQLNSLSGADRAAEHKALEQIFTDCKEPRQRLKLALLMGGIEPELANYNLARTLLEGCLTAARGPVLSGYIRSALRLLEWRERYHGDYQTVSRQLAIEQRKNAALQQRVKTLEKKIEALADIEQSLQNRRPGE